MTTEKTKTVWVVFFCEWHGERYDDKLIRVFVSKTRAEAYVREANRKLPDDTHTYEAREAPLDEAIEE